MDGILSIVLVQATGLVKPHAFALPQLHIVSNWDRIDKKVEG
jgi:hypothetical protein